MREQAERFDRLAGQFEARLRAVREHEEPAATRDDWARRNEELAAALLPRPPRDFLAHPTIRFQMFVDDRYLQHELPYVLERVPDRALLREDPVGEPPAVPVPGAEFTTSSNTVHHLHHLLRYEDATGRAIADAATIVEWGAGYGNLAKLLLRLHGGSPTCVLVDIPTFSAVQWLYLGTVLGEDRVVLHAGSDTPVVPGRVNLVPTGLAAGLDVSADLFVSTWALNESAAAAQRLVLDREFFGAPAVMLAMHRGDPLDPEAIARGVRPVPLGDFMPGQHYFVR